MFDKSEQVRKTKTVRDIRKENFGSDKILRDIRTLYESEEDYYEPVGTSNAFNKNYIDYENNRDQEKILSTKEYIDMIRQYLSDIINDQEAQGKWKNQLTMKINFISSKNSKCSTDFNETRNMHTTSDNMETMIGNETDEIIEELFESLLKKYHKGLEKSMKGIEFILDSVDLLYYKLYRISLNRGNTKKLKK